MTSIMSYLRRQVSINLDLFEWIPGCAGLTQYYVSYLRRQVSINLDLFEWIPGCAGMTQYYMSYLRRQVSMNLGWVTEDSLLCRKAIQKLDYQVLAYNKETKI